MPVYAYRTISRTGKPTDGTIEAASEAVARSMLRSRSEVVTQIKETDPNRPARAKLKGKKPSADEVASTVQQIGILIRAGVPLVEGLRSLGEQTKSDVLQAALTQMADEVSTGSPLSESFLRQSHVFPLLAVDMARIAEAGGNLAESMSRLADYLEKSAEIKRKVKAALAYPMVVVCISAVTVIVLVTFIMPKFMKLFKSMGAEIPVTTRILMAMSHIAVERWYVFVALAVISFVLFTRFARTDKGRHTLDAISLKLPLIGDVVCKIVLSRVLASMSTLLSSGVPMVQTLEISATAADNAVVRDALLGAKRCVAEGVATSESLKASNIFPPLVLQMVASGEKTGELPMMLDHVCAMYSRETDAKVKSLTSVIEPILIVLLGLVVGFVAISVILPIYSLVGSVK
jgi:type IV pilus assembly protein PilC